MRMTCTPNVSSTPRPGQRMHPPAASTIPARPGKPPSGRVKVMRLVRSEVLAGSQKTQGPAHERGPFFFHSCSSFNSQ